MISLFIFKSNSRGMQYGMGTYMNELVCSLQRIQFLKIYIIAYRSGDCKEFTTNRISEKTTEISIPDTVLPMSRGNNFEKKYASSVVRLVSGLIRENEKVIFQVNYIDDLEIAKKLKDSFRHPVISIVHFAQWQQLFNGNRKKLIGLNINEPSDNIEFTLSQERELYRISDHVISVTRYMKYFLINEYRIEPDKITVIHNGIDAAKFIKISADQRDSLKKKLGFNKEDIIILFSGRIDPCKGVIFLMEAFENACKQNDNLRLVLLGQGSIYDCQKKLRSSFGKVTYTGFVEKDLVTSFYNVADIGIAPSIYDHCPYTILEMIASRVPVIASRTNGLDELLDESSCIFIDQLISEEGEISFSTDDITTALLILAESKNLREKLSAAAYDLLIRNFLSYRMAQEMTDLYSSLICIKEIVIENEETIRR